MSQDITVHAPRNLAAAPEDLWGQPNGNSLGAYQPHNGQAQPQPLKKLNRLLRGRWLLAICLSLAGAVGGAVAGFKSQVPLYAGMTAVEIQPVIRMASLIDKVTPYFNQAIKNEALSISGNRVVEEALKRPEWVEAGGHKFTRDYIAVFQTNLTSTLVKDSSMIQISFQSDSPKLAAAGANAVMKAYMTIRQSEVGDEQSSKLRVANQGMEDAEREKQATEDQINEVSKGMAATDLMPQLAEMMKNEETLEFDIQMQTLAIQTAEAAVPDAKGNRNVKALTAEDIAQFDPQMRSLLDIRQTKRDALARDKELFGPNHPSIVIAMHDLKAADDSVNTYTQAASKQYLGVQSTGTTPTGLIPITPASLDAQRADLQRRQAALDSLRARLHEKGSINQRVRQLQQQVDRAQEKIHHFQDNIEGLAINGALNGTIVPQGDASEPSTPAVDKRKQVALMGLVLGGGVPFGLMLLIGLLDSRYRYSDDTNDVGVNGLTLLGILPNLPDRLSDPGQASIAAHCVHQIRTMLQINSNMMPDRRAFSVTSASSGDGKTSLTLALGLSFAASGSRTLLIDSDLVGAGLTARLGMNGPEGVLEAMTSGNVLEYVKQTDVSDLSILPVGFAQLHHAGIFSPQSVRRLVNEAKKHFEVILIDTGPILGSIEATPVAAASDGVILTVARGQQRPLVEKALAHLNSIGARVAGVVFNRAQARDFEQSISGISMRSASRSSNGNGNGASRVGQQKDVGQYGPVARAVASSTKSAESPSKN